MHFQRTPHQEQKLIRCLRGTVHDVALDLRKDSPTFGTSLGITLSEDNGRAVFLPGGIAHGFLTLCDDCVLHYAMDVSYVALAALGIRWNDPSFSIDWPMEPTLISKSDQNWPDYER